MPLGGVWIEHDVRLERLDRLLDFLSKSVEGLHELLLLFGFTSTPVVIVKFVNEGFVDVVDDRVKCEDGVFANLTEEHLVVVGGGCGDGLAWWHGASHEVDTLSLNLFFLAYEKGSAIWRSYLNKGCD